MRRHRLEHDKGLDDLDQQDSLDPVRAADPNPTGRPSATGSSITPRSRHLTAAPGPAHLGSSACSLITAVSSVARRSSGGPGSQQSSPVRPIGRNTASRETSAEADLRSHDHTHADIDALRTPRSGIVQRRMRRVRGVPEPPHPAGRTTSLRMASRKPHRWVTGRLIHKPRRRIGR